MRPAHSSTQAQPGRPASGRPSSAPPWPPAAESPPQTAPRRGMAAARALWRPGPRRAFNARAPALVAHPHCTAPPLGTFKPSMHRPAPNQCSARQHGRPCAPPPTLQTDGGVPALSAAAATRLHPQRGQAPAAQRPHPPAPLDEAGASSPRQRAPAPRRGPRPMPFTRPQQGTPPPAPGQQCALLPRCPAWQVSGQHMPNSGRPLPPAAGCARATADRPPCVALCIALCTHSSGLRPPTVDSGVGAAATAVGAQGVEPPGAQLVPRAEAARTRHAPGGRWGAGGSVEVLRRPAGGDADQGSDE